MLQLQWVKCVKILSLTSLRRPVDVGQATHVATALTSSSGHQLRQSQQQFPVNVNMTADGDAAEITSFPETYIHVIPFLDVKNGTVKFTPGS